MSDERDLKTKSSHIEKGNLRPIWKLSIEIVLFFLKQQIAV